MVATKDEFFQGLKQWQTDERKLEFIENEMNKGMSTEVKIAVLISRAEIYLRKKWRNLAATDYCNAAALPPTFREQIELYFKGALAYLLADKYLSADDVFRKVLVLAPESEKQKLKEKIIMLYLERATTHEQKKKYIKAIAAFEKVLSLNLDFNKKIALYDKLIELYEKIGKPHEAIQIREQKNKEAELTNTTD